MAGFGLINMNGRLGVYPAASGNPYLQRFLSPDNFVQNLNNAQNFNRYSYCLNNPLMYTDPSGWQMAAADEYWNLGKERTNQVDFGIGNYYGEATNGGASGGWWDAYQDAHSKGYEGDPVEFLKTLDEKQKTFSYDDILTLSETTYYYSGCTTDGGKTFSNLTYLYSRTNTTKVSLKQFAYEKFGKELKNFDNEVDFVIDKEHEYTHTSTKKGDKSINGHTKAANNNYYKSGNAIIYINPDINGPYQLEIVLGHELVHAYHITNGFLENWLKDEKTNDIAALLSEYYAYDFSSTLEAIYDCEYGELDRFLETESQLNLLYDNL